MFWVLFLISIHHRLVFSSGMSTLTWCMRSITIQYSLGVRPSTTSLHANQSAAATLVQHTEASLWWETTTRFYSELAFQNKGQLSFFLTCLCSLQPSVADILNLAWWTSTVAWWGFVGCKSNDTFQAMLAACRHLRGPSCSAAAALIFSAPCSYNLANMCWLLFIDDSDCISSFLLQVCDPAATVWTDPQQLALPRWIFSP